MFTHEKIAVAEMRCQRSNRAGRARLNAKWTRTRGEKFRSDAWVSALKELEGINSVIHAGKMQAEMRGGLRVLLFIISNTFFRSGFLNCCEPMKIMEEIVPVKRFMLSRVLQLNMDREYY